MQVDKLACTQSTEYVKDTGGTNPMRDQSTPRYRPTPTPLLYYYGVVFPGLWSFGALRWNRLKLDCVGYTRF